MNPADSDRSRRQWSTNALAGITAAGTLLGGVAGFLALFIPQGGSVNVGPQPTATVTVTVTPAPNASAQVSSSQQATAGVRWHGTVLITNEPADLDAVPVNNDDKSGDGMDAYFGGTSDLEVSGPSFVWSGATDPTRSQCAAKLPTNGVTGKSYEPVSHGMRICVQTDTGRIALLKIVKDDSDGITTDVTVWD